jgi:heparan-alpha-glucosaminide N-acetyltransferase
MMPSTSQRLASIDVIRALTMLLMIFVNDLWTLVDIPLWLEHTAAKDDGMGLADTVFPAFLFIVGLSIPFAIGGRLSKDISQANTLGHICIRSLALLVMGFFHVNLENYNKAAALLPKPVFQILLTVAFFLIWLDYPSQMKKQKRWMLQGSGIFILLLLAIVYKGGDENQVEWLRPHWWGILGLIGWSYLLSALVFLFAKGRLPVLILALLFFNLFNIAAKAGWLEFLQPVRPYIWITGDGSSPALTMAGVVVAVIYAALTKKSKFKLGITVLLLIGLAMLLAGFAIRPLGGISKIRATPSWVLICTGISTLVFTGLAVLVDHYKKHNWFTLIQPAGTSTLTAYLLPYIHYALFQMIAISLPLFFRTGIVGIIKSLLYALCIILITGWLEKRRLRLKI